MRGEHVREILEKKGFKTSYIAEKLNISLPALHSKLKSKSVTIDFLKDISIATGIPLIEWIEVKAEKELDDQPGDYIAPHDNIQVNDDIELERLKEAIEFLKTARYIRNQQDLVERINYNKSTVSQILNGQTKVSKQFVYAFCEIFPQINSNYILNGERPLHTVNRIDAVRRMVNDKKADEADKLGLLSKDAYISDDPVFKEIELLKKQILLLENQLSDKDEIISLKNEKIANLESELENLKGINKQTG